MNSGNLPEAAQSNLPVEGGEGVHQGQCQREGREEYVSVTEKGGG